VSLLGYTLGQSAKHQLPGHPALYEGSSLPDLVGARRLEGFDPATIHKLLPRFSVSEALRAVRLPEMARPSADAARALGATAIAEASERAYAADLGARDPAALAARRAAVAVQQEVGIPATETAFALGISQRAANRLRGRVGPADGEVLWRRLGLDAAADRRAYPARSGTAVAR
jgi:hypothetical protein